MNSPHQISAAELLNHPLGKRYCRRMLELPAMSGSPQAGAVLLYPSAGDEIDRPCAFLRALAICTKREWEQVGHQQAHDPGSRTSGKTGAAGLLWCPRSKGMPGKG